LQWRDRGQLDASRAAAGRADQQLTYLPSVERSRIRVCSTPRRARTRLPYVPDYTACVPMYRIRTARAGDEKSGYHQFHMHVLFLPMDILEYLR
jgi:hypothetical protein